VIRNVIFAAPSDWESVRYGGNIAERPGSPCVRTEAFPEGRGMLSESRRDEFMPRAEGRADAGRPRSVVDGGACRLPIREFGQKLAGEETREGKRDGGCSAETGES
jgi:hypothetical protein